MTIKRILFLAPVGEKGGAETVLLDIARGLDPARYLPVVACLKPGAFVEELRGLGITAHALPAHQTRQFHKVGTAIRGLRRIIRQERIDLIHANGSSMLLYAALASARTRCRVVWQVHDPLCGGGLFERAFVAAQRRMRPDWTIFSNPAVAESYLGTYQNLARNSTILPGVDAEGLRRGADAARGRAALGIAEDAPVIALFARLQRAKGHSILIQAAKQVLRRYPDARFLICGGSLFGLEPDYPDEITREMADAGISDSMRLCGYVAEEEKRDILAASTLVVHPALSEPFGISVIEGMAAGKPVVVTDCVGPAMTVVNGETGLVVPRGDADALAGALLFLLDHPEQARRMGRCGRIRVEENYTLGAMVQQVQDAYAQVWSAA